MPLHLSEFPSRLRRFCAATAFYAYNHGVSRIPVYSLRHAYLRQILRIRIGAGAAVHSGCFVTGNKIVIGERSVINRGCYLDGRGGLEIGSDASISPGCCLISLTHDVQDPRFEAVAKPVRIGNRAWLGTRTIVLPGVDIGKGAVAGAGAVVSRSVPPFAVVAGNPARKIAERNPNLDYTLSYFPYFDTDITP
jgi:maltose O-acetyltransferase